MSGHWHVRAFCPCGWSREAFCGNIWFVQNDYPVCPECGEHCSEYELRTVRWERVGPWYWPSGKWADLPNTEAI